MVQVGAAFMTDTTVEILLVNTAHTHCVFLVAHVCFILTFNRSRINILMLHTEKYLYLWDKYTEKQYSNSKTLAAFNDTFQDCFM